MSQPHAPFPQLRAIDFRTAGRRDIMLLSAFWNQILAEREPDEPPTPMEEQAGRWRNLPAYVQMFAWVVPDPSADALAAVGTLAITHTNDNTHLGEADVAVLPRYRRHGLARMLLGPIAATAEQEGRRVLIGNTNERVPAGAAFMTWLGAKNVQAFHVNQLKLGELDREVAAQWLREGNSQELFELGFWTGPYPEEDLEGIASLYRVMNQAPRGDLEMEDVAYTPARVRQMDEAELGQAERWTAYVRERATGAFAGFTQVYWRSSSPTLLNQGDTGVLPQYRNRGLGRWLKAAMIEKVLRERPQVQRIRTGNADSNAPMLSINTALGFRPYLARAVWQVETAQVRERVH